MFFTTCKACCIIYDILTLQVYTVIVSEDETVEIWTTHGSHHILWFKHTIIVFNITTKDQILLPCAKFKSSIHICIIELKQLKRKILEAFNVFDIYKYNL